MNSFSAVLIFSYAQNTNYIYVVYKMFFVEFLAKEFNSKYGIDISDDFEAVARLRAATERMKRQLSLQQTGRLAIDQLHGRQSPNAIDFETSMMRDEIENLNSDIFMAALVVAQNALSKAGMEKKDVHKILLVGEFLVQSR